MRRIHLPTMARWLVASSLAAALQAAAQAPTDSSRHQVTDVRTLLQLALDAPEGRAAGLLVGPAADAIGQRFQATGPIQVDVHTLQRLAQPGCSRLSVQFAQDGVRLPGAAAASTRTIDFGLNYCRDGQPPAGSPPRRATP